MRILSGQYKGFEIGHGRGSGVRPTQSKIRKSLFDYLGPLRGDSFTDLFAGTGIIGLESASRGANPVTLVESNSIRFKTLRKEVQKFDKTKINIYREDVFRFLEHTTPTDYLFADPPYELLDYSHMESLVKLAMNNLKPGGTFILETNRKELLVEDAVVKSYGDSFLHIWTNHD